MLKKTGSVILYFSLISLFFLNGYALKRESQDSIPDSLLTGEKKCCSFPIVAVGDLQRTSIWETMIGRENNDIERNEIIKNISEQNPGSVVLLGDMVFEGDDGDQWKYFDNLMSPIEKKAIPLFPVIGNHEYWGVDQTALQFLSKRFPMIKGSHWYTEISDSIALIFLDSNDGEYSVAQWQTQTEWFKNQLLLFDNDPAIKGILVFAHHPPYTNSLVTGDEMQVQTGFVPAFDQSKKTLAFITGHAHTYERFIENGKTFIISGGGGGPRVVLRNGSGSHRDYYSGPSPRPFNYLLINKQNDGLEITVKGVNKNSGNFFNLEKFTLAYYKDNMVDLAEKKSDKSPELAKQNLRVNEFNSPIR